VARKDCLHVDKTPPELLQEIRNEGFYEDSDPRLAKRADEIGAILGLPSGTPWPAVKYIVWYLVHEKQRGT